LGLDLTWKFITENEIEILRALTPVSSEMMLLEFNTQFTEDSQP